MEAGLGLDDHRQAGRAGPEARLSQGADGRAAGRVARRRPRSRAPPTRARTRSRGCRPARAGPPPRLPPAPPPRARQPGTRARPSPPTARRHRPRHRTRRRAHRRSRGPARTDASTRSTGTPSAAWSARLSSSTARPGSVVARKRYPTWSKNGGPSSAKKAMLACASRTSAAVENCWRTPPIAREVDPPPIRPRSQSTISGAPRSARW